ncbi:hypothetical protein GC1_00007 [Gluconobacter phage GC1]|uniref:Uncharacterized protein n=1 Tax=Gluconobacter phage GC1 TaxID=2047788 RepID=A0A2I5AR68_9VIRU|nr:hypothetical protein FDJ08_gp07 [Gluconobacter phage GC1]ATS92575.1 hypothetical protein GC1_00007 [Gluconobacter phage GC1]
MVINGGEGETPAAVIVSGEDANAATETASAISQVEELQDKTINAAVTLEAATALAEEEKQRHILEAARRADEHADEMATIRRELEENRQWRDEQRTQISEMRTALTEALETMASMLSTPETDTTQSQTPAPEAETLIVADPETVAAEESEAAPPVAEAPAKARRRFRLV